MFLLTMATSKESGAVIIVTKSFQRQDYCGLQDGIPINNWSNHQELEEEWDLLCNGRWDCIWMQSETKAFGGWPSAGIIVIGLPRTRVMFGTLGHLEKLMSRVAFHSEQWVHLCHESYQKPFQEQLLPMIQERFGEGQCFFPVWFSTVKFASLY